MVLASISESVIKDVIRVAIACAGTYISFRMLMGFLDPHRESKIQSQKKLKEYMELLDLPKDLSLDDYEIQMASMLVPLKQEISWKDIGGCEEIIHKLHECLVIPLKMNKDKKYISKLLLPSRGILLYGPPGCGKTLLARILAESVDARFIDLDISKLMDKWYGETHKFVAALFSLAKKIQPTIIFIDEIDIFLRERSMMDNESTAMMKAQFMTLWDGFASSNDQVIIVGATNSINNIDAAILRRLPLKFYVPIPDNSARAAILKIALCNEACTDFNFEKVAKYADGLSGSDLKEVCRYALLRRCSSMYKENEEINEDNVIISEKDLLKSILEYRSIPEKQIFLIIDKYNNTDEPELLNNVYNDIAVD